MEELHQIKPQEDWIQQVGYHLFSIFYIISSMAEQQNANPGDIREVALQADLLKNCLKKFPDLEGKVKNAQLASIQLKYQYFLRKFGKYNEEHQKYRTIYESIEKTVDESAQIKEQNRSIEFIKKIMEDTEKKYNKLRQNIEQLKIQKESTLNELTSLTSNLKQLKNQFFQLKRKVEEGQNKLKEEGLQIKTKQNFKHMFKIRHEKKLTQVLAKKIKPIECSQLLGQPSVVDRKVWDQFEKVNNLKEDFLRQIGINHQEFYKLNEKELNEQSKMNKLITKKKIAHIRNYLLKHDPVSETEPLEVFKIVNEYDKEYQEFMGLPTRDLIKLIIKQNKVGEVLQMMEQQKRATIAAYQTFKSSKSKCL